MLLSWFLSACVRTISKRLNKTKNWIVALKTLMLIQRLLTDGDPTYKQEIFFATRRGTRLLNMSDFRDTSRSNSWDFSAFVRTYALYIDEQLEFKMQGRWGKRSAFSYEDAEEIGSAALVVRATPVREMKNEQIFSRIRHLMQLLERFLACRPTGAAKNNRVVCVALYPIVKESFQLYYDITEIMGILIDRFMELNISDSVKVHGIFCRFTKQYDELDMFYDWCKIVGIARASEYPEVEKITQQKLDLMDEFIREKSVMAQNQRVKNVELMNEPAEETVEEAEPEEDMNAIKALPPPEGFSDETEKEEVDVEETKEEENKTQQGDLLNLGEDAPTTEEHGEKLALALFDDGFAAATTVTGTSAWEAFNESDDWETALVQSASHLSNQKAVLPEGSDTLMLDGMYQQGVTAAAAASSGYLATGSASSVALGSAGRPAMLALPAPPAADGGAAATPGADPFAASLAVAPPSYVQMTDMETKQRLLVEEQLMWQQYARDGMQGQVRLANVQPNPYPYNVRSGVY
ncbi:unnamed protein product [Ilex paraguariensis]|uniref:ENTH domain-containing protein n=1 Tax=Ilex paraguariensis TaxID=185542 RepID=A0ABC8R6Q9_9AQUA